MKISTKLYTGFLIVVALTAALGFYAFYSSRATLIQVVSKESLSLSEEIMKRIDRSIHDKMMEVGAATNRSWIISIVAESNSQFEKLENSEDYLVRTENQWEAAANDRANALQKELQTNDLANELRDEFINYYEAAQGFSEVSILVVTNRFGASIAQTDQVDHFRHDGELWWQEARRLGIFVGDMEYDEETASYGIPAAFSIVDDNGDFLGVLKTVIDAKTLILVTELANKKYQTTRIKLLTQDGKILYLTKPYKFMQDFSSEDFFQKITDDQGSFVARSEGDRERLYSYVRSKGKGHYRGFGWILMLGHDLEEILAPANAMKNRIAVASLIMVLATVIFAFFISRTIVLSLAKLSEGVERIGKGDLTHRIELDTTDEVGQLARSFNNMTKNLKKITASRDELDQEITERKQVEKERTKLTAEVISKNREMEQLIYVTSHDLRSPLVNIQGFSKELENAFGEFLQLYETDEMSAKAKEKLESLLREDMPESLKFIKSSIHKMDILLSGLLDLSRLGRIKLNIEMCDMHKLLLEVIRTNEYLITSAGAKVELGPLPPCRCDADQTSRVFSNLLDNALKYLDPERSGHIIISGHVNEGRAVYCMEDNGIGIAPEDQKKIFGIFYRLNPEMSSGEGLGLTIINQILLRQNGQMWLESEPDKGSKFYVELPG